MLDYATVYNIGEGIEWELFRWAFKEKHFKTDKRHSETMKIVEEAQRYLDQEGEMSLRFLFYHLVSIGLLRNILAQCQGLTEKMTTAS